MLRQTPFAAGFHGLENFTFQKSAFSQNFDELIFQIADFKLSRDPHQHRAQVELGLLAVKAGQALHQRRRNDENGVGIAERIADQESGSFLDRRRHEIQVAAQAG